MRLKNMPNSAQEPRMPIAFVRYSRQNATTANTTFFALDVNTTGPTLRASRLCRNMKT
ncbi:unnamed protein product [Chondrus crispus]|uniref:Uncharacterized protein n=1 Tax=Chondrus crispus TaxID=2769 RepID=R7QQI1_CHOCR|nr:unnamed protein product [Chondrus crispus]CDF39746.1 unnamed protein product [Chondrus crispus]|eukprot:XP_005710040.1 unnamed protein product [Chondrus crispus]